MSRKFTVFSLLLFLGFWATAQTINVSMSSTPACSLDGTVTAIATGGTPPYSYTWYWSGNQTTTTTVNNLANMPGGWVGVQVSDAGSGQGWGNAQVTEPFTLNNITTPDTCGMGVGSANVSVSGGTPPYTYLWSTGATTPAISGLVGGQYDVTVHDANGCMYASTYGDSTGVFVWDWSPINVNVTTTPSSCVDGSATATATNGTGPYSYYWYNPWDPTFVTQTTQTATNLGVGGVYVKVTDATGCVTERYVYVPQGTPPFTATASSTAATCLASNGTASVSVNGSTGPYTYLWSNGATTQSITNVPAGGYGVTITDNNGCPITKGISVQRYSPIQVSLSATDPSCGMSNGTVSATPSNGTAPYTYNWSNGATTSSITGLADGYYSVIVTDANGCTENKWTRLEYAQSCYGVISGTVYQENTGNCNPVAGNVPIPNVFITDGSYWDNTNSLGQFSISALPGTYTVEQPYAPLYHNLVCPSSPANYSVTLAGAGAVSAGNDFYNEPIVPVQDLRVVAYSSPARPGFNQTVYIRVYNQGTTPSTPSLEFVHDALLNYITAVPIATNYISGTQTATWNLGSIPAGGSTLVQLTLGVPTTAVLGTSIAHMATANPVAGDSTPVNNVYNINRFITGSFDPNDKAVFPEGDISTDQLLEYTIQFQNTGTDTAFTVMISDSLDGNLDPGTFVEGVSSHDYTLSISGPGILEFTFDNILLPDSNINEPESHGFVTFYMKPKANLAPGTRIPNTASIYFDFNAPIITNTVENEIETVVAVEPGVLASNIQVYPNPTQDLATVSYRLDQVSPVNISLYNLHGQQVYDSGTQEMISGEHRHVFSTEAKQIPNGIYLVKVAIGKTVTVKRLSVAN